MTIQVAEVADQKVRRRVNLHDQTTPRHLRSYLILKFREVFSLANRVNPFDSLATLKHRCPREVAPEKFEPLGWGLGEVSTSSRITDPF